MYTVNPMSFVQGFLTALLAVACMPAEKTSIDIPLDTTTGHPIVALMINGSGPYNFIVDTGAPVGVIDSKLAGNLALVAFDSAEIGDGTTSEMTPRYYIGSLIIGGYNFEDIPLDDFPLGEIFVSNIQGIIGMDTFESGLLIFDFPSNRLIWEEGEGVKPGEEVLPYELDEGQFTIFLTIDDDQYGVHLDTGSGTGFTLPGEMRDKFSYIRDPIIVGRARTVSREIDVWRGRLAGSIELAGSTFVDPDISFIDGLKKGNIGQKILRTYILSIDQAHKLIQLKRP